MPDVISYDAALKQIGAKPCSLLLGNGFSADYCGYQTLLEHSGLAADAPCRVLFDRLGTVNFERVVSALEDASVVEAVSRAIRVIAGQLPRLVDEAEQALTDSGLPIFARGGTLMYPIRESVPASDGRMTTTAKLRPVTPDLLLRWLAEAATFIHYDAHTKAWVDIDPPRQLAATQLAGQDRWPFPRIAGVVTTPLLRPDGSLLIEAGYHSPRAPTFEIAQKSSVLASDIGYARASPSQWLRTRRR